MNPSRLALALSRSPCGSCEICEMRKKQFPAAVRGSCVSRRRGQMRKQATETRRRRSGTSCACVRLLERSEELKEQASFVFELLC